MSVHKHIKSGLIILMFGLFLGMSALAQAFVVKNIQFKGLVRVTHSMLGDLPIKTGDDLTNEQSNHLVKYLYNLNMPYPLFKQVSLWDDHGTLVIAVSETPTIAKVDFSGNVEIKKDQIAEVLKKAQITQGKVYSPFMLDQIRGSFLEAYYAKGKYAAKINIEVKPVKNNQVSINIKISEGLEASIASINFIGNHVFSDHTLLGELTLTTPRPWTFFTNTDKYSKESMQKSITALSAYYLNRGYLNFRVSSYQVALSPFRRHTYLTFNLHEGGRYTFGDYTLLGKFVLPKAVLRQKVLIQKGNIFSKKTVLDSIKNISDALADKGYAYANVTPDLKVDEKHHIVAITLHVNPGKRVYIRYIHFLGNTVTNDRVFRQYMQIMESSPYNKSKIELSKTFIQRLAYIKSADQSLSPVLDTPDAVDLNFKITEQSANRLMANIGYDTFSKWFVGTGITFANVFGTGNTFSLSTQLGKYQKQVNATFTQPFFTDSGISQSISVYWQTTNTSQLDYVSYMMDRIGGSVNYGIPISTFNYFNIGFGLDHTAIKLPDTNISQVVRNFTNDNGKIYNNATINIGWSRDSTDLHWFPTKGVRATLSAGASVPLSTLNYYTLSSDAKWFHAIWKKVVFTLSGNAFYGQSYGKTGEFPFYLNRYSGGWGTVRGYSNGSFGPASKVSCDSSDTTCDHGYKPFESVGGNLLVNASAGLVFPIPYVESDNVRLTVFGDTGYVYETKDLPGIYQGPYKGSSFNYTNPHYPTFSNLRWSVGTGVLFIMPALGPIGLSFAKAINAKPGDSRSVFNFSIGQSF